MQAVNIAMNKQTVITGISVSVSVDVLFNLVTWLLSTIKQPIILNAIS